MLVEHRPAVRGRASAGQLEFDFDLAAKKARHAFVFMAKKTNEVFCPLARGEAHHWQG